MEQKDRDYFRHKLEELQRQLLSDAEKTINEMTDHQSSYPDPNDRATAESDRSFELRIRDRERKLLVKINEAIERINQNSYGLCEDCGSEISLKRLEARPVTTLCIACKTIQENKEKSQEGH